MNNLFDTIPSGFFNCLANVSNNRIYSDCLQVIYEQYDREITYRLPRSRIRDAIAAYLLENHIEYLEEEDELLDRRDYNEMANAVIRRFCSRDVGWLSEDNDEATFEKHIIITEQGLMLIEFLQQLIKPERAEFSSYIFNIYNILRNPEQWETDPYVDGLRNIYRNARLLSKALKRLATFIKNIIERMVQEESLESLTENLLEYCEGSFIREYARLTKQQNVHIYRSFIKAKLTELQDNEEVFDLLVKKCASEEGMDAYEAREFATDMVQITKRFLVEDYDRIMRDIKHKINIYLQIAIGRARFLRNREADLRGNVEQTIRYLANEMKTLGWRDEIPNEMQGLFNLDKSEFIDTASIRYPRRQRSVKGETAVELEQMTEEDIENTRAAQEKEAYNPYARDKMKKYLEVAMNGKETLSSDDLPMQGKRDLLCALSAVAYSGDNGYSVELLDGYTETDHMLLKRFAIKKEEKA